MVVSCAFLLGVVLFYTTIVGATHNPMHNTSSPEFLAQAAETYAKVIPCITTWMYPSGHLPNFSFPKDAERHFAQIKNLTTNFTRGAYHTYAGYSGPWIENEFIHKYYNHSLHSFRGLIPLFIQWIDNYVLHRHQYEQLQGILRKMLRPNVLYFTVVQSAEGLGRFGPSHPNILIFSSGGFGHVPIPLIKGELPVAPHDVEFKHEIGFFGTPKPVVRLEMLNTINDTARALNMTYKQAKGKLVCIKMNCLNVFV